MQTRNLSHSSGSGLIVTLGALAIIALLVGSYLQTITPRYRSFAQGASWSESLQAAEAGANYGVRMLNVEAAANRSNSPNWASDWTGKSWTLQAAGYHQLSSSVTLGGTDGASASKVCIDTYTTNPGNGDVWYRIRSEARANLPGHFVSLDRRDAELRHMNLSATSGGQPAPYVKRVVEVIAKPKYRFSMAIATMQGLSLANSANWLVDSFDSGSTAKSDPGTAAGGVYPSASTKQQTNGDIGTLKPEPAGTQYGTLITGNGAIVRGDVSTVGGDDPSTTAHENVSGSAGMDQTRIFDNFDEDLAPIAKPAWITGIAANPAGLTGFSTTPTKSAPMRYIVNSTLGAFAVTAPATGIGYVEILVNGDLSIGSGNKAKIVIPPTVFATVYVDGNVDFGNGTVNSDSASSQVAANFTVVGVNTAANASYSASGNGNDTLAFYGPNYSIGLNGTVTTVGAVIGKSFSINGGGNGGFHYDEALSRGGLVSGYTVASYFDDARTDVK